jgi:hypothetical protein
MGRVLKLSYDLLNDPGSYSDTVPSRPWYVFNNSWYLRCPLIGGNDPHGDPQTNATDESNDFTNHLTFFNNAIEWCDATRHGSEVCETIELIKNFDWRKSEDVLFDLDICNRTDFKQGFAPPGRGEEHGIVARRPIFVEATNGDFRPASDSEAVGSGGNLQLATSSGDLAPIQPGQDGLLNRGALQSYGLTSVPDLDACLDNILTKFQLNTATS